MSTADDSPFSVARQTTMISANVNSTLLFLFLFGIYTGVFPITIYVYIHKENRMPARDRIIIGCTTALYFSTALDAVYTCLYMNKVFGKDFGTRIQMFTESLDQIPVMSFAENLINDLSTWAVFLVADGLLVWRCFHSCGRSFRRSLLPFVLLTVETAMVIITMSYYAFTALNPLVQTKHYIQSFSKAILNFVHTGPNEDTISFEDMVISFFSGPFMQIMSGLAPTLMVARLAIPSGQDNNEDSSAHLPSELVSYALQESSSNISADIESGSLGAVEQESSYLDELLQTRGYDPPESRDRRHSPVDGDCTYDPPDCRINHCQKMVLVRISAPPPGYDAQKPIMITGTLIRRCWPICVLEAETTNGTLQRGRSCQEGAVYEHETLIAAATLWASPIAPLYVRPEPSQFSVWDNEWAKKAARYWEQGTKSTYVATIMQGSLVYDTSGTQANMRDDSIWRAVLLRDGKECALSGPAGDKAVVSWIVPPAYMEWDDYEGKYESPDAIRIPRNCITLHGSLQAPFMNNAISIDVDDDYRIVVLDQIGEDALQLLAKENFRAYRLKENVLRGGENGVELSFIRAHFKYSLCTKFSGGDVYEDYTIGDIQGIGELGDIVSPNHAFWDTVGGKDLISLLIGQEYRNERGNHPDCQNEKVEAVTSRLLKCEQEEEL
ncbi:hypothetical protein CPC08DRAFT_728949 [Agrocybe pediades]|nr:hypothetical protein CPC08DRAFT_728949 [Agrocybe pediades]